MVWLLLFVKRFCLLCFFDLAFFVFIEKSDSHLLKKLLHFRAAGSFLVRGMGGWVKMSATVKSEPQFNEHCKQYTLECQINITPLVNFWIFFQPRNAYLKHPPQKKLFFYFYPPVPNWHNRSKVQLAQLWYNRQFIINL